MQEICYDHPQGDPSATAAGYRELIDAFRSIIEQWREGWVALIGATGPVALLRNAQHAVTRHYPWRCPDVRS